MNAENRENSNLQDLIDKTNENGEVYFSHLELVLEVLDEFVEKVEEDFGFREKIENENENLDTLAVLGDEKIQAIKEDEEYLDFKNTANQNCKYHCGDHWDLVESLGIELAEYQKLSSAEKELLQLFAMFHDIDHNGRIEGKDWEDNVKRSLHLAAYFCEKHKIPLANTLKLLGMITSSASFHEKIEPKNNLDRTSVMADLGAFSRGIEIAIDNGIQVAQESSEAIKPTSFDAFLQGQWKFYVGHLKPKLEEAREQNLIPGEWILQHEKTLTYLVYWRERKEGFHSIHGKVAVGPVLNPGQVERDFRSRVLEPLA